MRRIKKIEKTLRNYDFVKVHEHTNIPIYDLVTVAKAGLHAAYDYEGDTPTFLIFGYFQIIIMGSGEDREFELQYIL